MWDTFQAKRKAEILRTGDSNCNLTKVFKDLHIKRICCRVVLRTSIDWEAQTVLRAPPSLMPTSRLHKIRTMKACKGTLRLEERNPAEEPDDPVAYVKPKATYLAR